MTHLETYLRQQLQTCRKAMTDVAIQLKEEERGNTSVEQIAHHLEMVARNNEPPPEPEEKFVQNGSTQPMGPSGCWPPHLTDERK
jgi:hypothetical protein